jgi:DNA-binding CsgD family transcriptional regulator
MEPTVTLQFVPAPNPIDASIRVIVFRESGSAILDIRRSAFAEFCEPASDAPHDVIGAFRESLPALLGSLNQVVATTPPGGVARVTAFASPRRKSGGRTSDLATQGRIELNTATDSPENDRPPVTLSMRQCAVLRLLSQGDTNRAISHKLGIGESTVNVHVRNLMKMLNARNRTQVVIFTGAFLKARGLGRQTLKPGQVSTYPGE